MPMARTTHQHPNKHIIALLLVTAVFIVDSNLAIMTQEGFSLELIHTDSIQSPLYLGNLTNVQRIQRLINSSDSRIYWLKSFNAGNHEMDLRPSIIRDRYDYVVKVFIGTPPKEVFLVFDTGSQLVWTQCEPCQQCFPQGTPKFVPKDSSTFINLPCSHPLCKQFQCINSMCQYHITYADKKYTKGILAKDHFMIQSSFNHHTESNGYLVFGCSTVSSVNMYSSGTKIGGILGMNRKPSSFVQQLYKHTKGCFSYCLVPDTSNGISYLRFGTDIPKSRNAQTIPLEWIDPMQRGNYFVDLKDISINGQRLNLPPGTFATRDNNNKGGCMFDSGTTLTYLVNPAFNVMRTALVDYFDEYNMSPFHHSKLNLDLCFRKRASFTEYPSMAFHFTGGATFQATKQHLFAFVDGSFCLLMKPHKSCTVLGSMLQQNVRMVYDISNRQVTFFPENCNQK